MKRKLKVVLGRTILNCETVINLCTKELDCRRTTMTLRG